MDFQNIEMSYKIATDRNGDQVYKFTLWMKGKKKETKITYTRLPLARDPQGREEEVKQYLLEWLLDEAKYTDYSFESWCIEKGLSRYDSRDKAYYRSCVAINKKLTKLNEGKPVHNYTFVGIITKNGSVGYQLVADDDWEKLKKEKFFRIYRLKYDTDTFDLGDRLLRVVRDRYPHLYNKKDPNDRIFSITANNYIAYFFEDGRWGIENCDDRRVERLKKQGVFKIFNVAKSKFRHPYYLLPPYYTHRSQDAKTWEVQVKLHRVMRDRYGVEPNDLD